MAKEECKLAKGWSSQCELEIRIRRNRKVRVLILLHSQTFL